MKRILSTLILVFFLTSASLADFGARPLGMGGAFTAIADDANAAYWNPAGFAINPGVDLTGSTLLSNRNEQIGDNIVAFKMCYEFELHPIVWALGLGAASLLALSGAEYLHDRGVLKKGWGRSDVPRVDEQEPVREQVLAGGEEKTVAVGQKIKEKAKEVAKEAWGSTKQTMKDVAAHTQVNVYWGPVYYPWYHRNYRHPSYWDYRNQQEEYSSQGKAQFGGGVTLLFDKNPILGQDTNFYTFSLATGYEERFAVGGNVKLYDIAVYTSTGAKLKGYGAGIDAGALLRPTDTLAFGLVAKEILTTDIHFENNTDLAYQMNVNAGVAFSPLEQVTLAGDIHNLFNQGGKEQTYHYGAEFRPFPGLALRGGLNDNNKCAGASIMVLNMIVDYTYLGGAFNRTQILGATYKF